MKSFFIFSVFCTISFTISMSGQHIRELKMVGKNLYQYDSIKGNLLDFGFLFENDTELYPLFLKYKSTKENANDFFTVGSIIGGGGIAIGTLAITSKSNHNQGDFTNIFNDILGVIFVGGGIIIGVVIAAVGIDENSQAQKYKKSINEILQLRKDQSSLYKSSDSSDFKVEPANNGIGIKIIF